MTKKLDSFDYRLLTELQRDNQQSAEVLAERIGRSASAVARRLRKLREDGVIAADVSILAEAAAGDPLFAIVHLQLERHALHEVEAFRRRLGAAPHVQLCFEISGAFDMLLLMVASDMNSFNRLADELLAGQAAVRRYETSFVKRRIKASLALPLEELGRE